MDPQSLDRQRLKFKVFSTIFGDEYYALTNEQRESPKTVVELITRLLPKDQPNLIPAFVSSLMGKSLNVSNGQAQVLMFAIYWLALSSDPATLPDMLETILGSLCALLKPNPTDRVLLKGLRNAIKAWKCFIHSYPPEDQVRSMALFREVLTDHQAPESAFNWLR